MHTSVRSIGSAVVFVLGLVLMVGGTIAGKHGATVIGLIVAAVSVQQFLKRPKETTHKQTGHTS